MSNDSDGRDKIKNFVCENVHNEKYQYAEVSEALWEKAKELFPKRHFPWKVLPLGLAESLKQLSRSCATSPTAIPGAAFSIFSSTLGSTIDISPKHSWNEPLIFWFADIRPSGSGKTPAARALCHKLYEEQKTADKNYRERLDDWQKQKADDKGPFPNKPRGYFITDLTLEGIRVDISGHGGTVCIMDELSSFLSAQNQYKNKGNDRESWINLWDGKPARTVRAKESSTIFGARVNVFGGVQPRIWQEFFGGKNGLFLEDGTIYRFLPTYEGPSFYPLTDEAWSNHNREIWEQTLTNALEWADRITSKEKWRPRCLCLSSDAQECFIDWRNDLFSISNMLPSPVRGFLPKITSYALRISGAIHCMERFMVPTSPDVMLSKEEMEKGIIVSMFYLGHIVNAIEALCSPTVILFERTEEMLRLSITLSDLKSKLDSGRLAMSVICDQYNAYSKPEEKITPKALGAMIRSLGFTVSRSSANGKLGAYCLTWDKKVDSFLKQSS